MLSQASTTDNLSTLLKKWLASHSPSLLALDEALQDLGFQDVSMDLREQLQNSKEGIV